MPPDDTTPIPSKPELLAPAGSWEAALAALEAGADALYIGLRDWSARGRAKNFELGDLQSLVPLAHSRSRRVYVALNTLLREDEMPSVLRAVWELACLGVDALIVQDLGLWLACRECFPELPLHASTQMSVHNSAGVRQLEAMGFSRVILGRECTIPEIARIRRETSLPLEVFVHGALCYSVSGLCLASSVLLGRSANRGWCGQPCRWGYRTGADREVHPFSCADLCLIDRVWDLAEAGVTSLKIEGRLKPADYVHSVVRAYRKVLDAPEDDRPGALGAARAILGSVASRPSSEGYAYHPRPRDVLRGGEQTGLGQRVGRVLGWKEGLAEVLAEVPLARGDRIRIASGDTGQGKAAVLREARREAGKKSLRLAFPWAARVNRGEAVYRVKTARGEELEQRLAKEARGIRQAQGFPARLRVGLRRGAIRIEARCGPATAVVEAPVETFPATEHPLDASVLERHLGRLGGTGYHLAGLEVSGELPAVVVPPSSFKELRRSLVSALDAAREREGAERLQKASGLRAAARADRSGSPRLWVSVETTAAVSELPRWDVHRVVVTVTRDTLKNRRRIVEALGSADRLAWALPPWIAEGDLGLYRKALETLDREGFRELLVSNLGHFPLVQGLGLGARAGWGLHSLSGWAAAALGRLGCASFVPSPETDRGNLEAAARAGWSLPPMALVYGDLPLFTTRLDGGGGPVRSADGEELRASEFPKPLGQPWTRIVGATPLSWTHHAPALQELGVRDFLVCLESRRYPQGETLALLRKLESGEPVEGTTDVNFLRGLEAGAAPRPERRAEDEADLPARRHVHIRPKDHRRHERQPLPGELAPGVRDAIPGGRGGSGRGAPDGAVDGRGGVERRGRVRAQTHGAHAPGLGGSDRGEARGGKGTKVRVRGGVLRRGGKDR